MTEKAAASRLAGWPSAVWAEFVQLGVIRHPITLAVLLGVVCVVFRIPQVHLDLLGAGALSPPVLEAYPLVLCVCAGWASVVWAQLRPEQRWYTNALPVRHTTFLLARATAGYVWMVLLLGVALAVSFGAGDGEHFVSLRWLLMAYATGATTAFCLVSAFAILVRIPLSVVIAVLAIPLGAGRLLRMNDMATVADYADRFLLGAHGLLGALAGMSFHEVNGQLDVAPSESWPVAAAVWLCVSLIGLYAAARVMARR